MTARATEALEHRSDLDPSARGIRLGLALAACPASVIELVELYATTHSPDVRAALAAGDRRADENRARLDREDARAAKRAEADDAFRQVQLDARARRLASGLGAQLRRQRDNPPSWARAWPGADAPRGVAMSDLVDTRWVVVAGDCAVGHGRTAAEAWAAAVEDWYTSASDPDLYLSEDPPPLAEVAAGWRLVRISAAADVADAVASALCRTVGW